jgi:hypothetical protein
LILGGVLNALHGFKVGWYLDVTNSSRRLMWTLAHAHGVLLALVHLVFAFTQRALPEGNAIGSRLASKCLLAASWLIPGGFFLGGLAIYGGDPGLGVLLVPVGALVLVVAVILIARDAGRSGASTDQP